MKIVFLWLIKFYQYFISPFLPMSCRFYPTCSQYTYGAIKHRGAIKGLSLALRRLLKCHPFHPGGYDPFPIGANKSTESK